MTTVARITYFVSNLENKPGALLRVMRELKAKNIALAGLWGIETREKAGRLYVVPENPEELKSAWESAGLLTGEGTGFFITGENRTGVLNESLDALANAGVNVDAIDAIAVGGQFGSYIWVDEADIDKASEALRTI
jgi:hypothetical protein